MGQTFVKDQRLIIKLSDYLFDLLAELGIDQAFCVTGGAAMHLNDSLGANPNIDVLYMHHEQACAMAAESYFRVSGKPALVCVTAGPGLLNALTGVAGAFTDSIAMVVVAGQVKTETLSDSDGELRQLGDQEVRTLPIVSSLSKFSARLSPELVGEQVTTAFGLAVTGRPGPVVLEVPLDIQAAELGDYVSPQVSDNSVEQAPGLNDEDIETLMGFLREAERPLIMAGSGVSIAGVRDDLIALAELSNIPVVTAWMHDVFDSNHPLSAGRSGTIGTRPGNFALQSADFLLVLGSRLNIRQTGYNFAQFAPNARVFWIDVDPAELRKPHLLIEHRVVADLKEAVPQICDAVESRPLPVCQEWLDWIRWVQRFVPQDSDYPLSEKGINPYHFVFEVNRRLAAGTVLACGDATACIVPFQVVDIRDGIRMFSNSGIASMGFDLPAAIGASLATDRPVVCFAGDGSIMMNLQEMATLAALGRDVLLFILDNNGYLSIRQTQENFFGRAFGSGPDSGVHFPDFESVASAFGLPVTVLRVENDWKNQLDVLFGGQGVRVCVVKLNPDQEFEPRIKSRKEGGGMYSPPLDDMYPFLGEEIVTKIRMSATGVLAVSAIEQSLG